MTTPFLVWGHEAAFLAYMVFAAIIAMRSLRTLHAALFLIVMLFTAAWAQSFVAVYLGYAPVWLEGVTAAARDGSWLALSLALMHRHANHTNYFRALAVVAVLLVALQIGLGLDGLAVGVIAGVRIDVTLIRMAMTIMGFVVLENVMRNASKGELTE